MSRPVFPQLRHISSLMRYRYAVVTGIAGATQVRQRHAPLTEVATTGWAEVQPEEMRDGPMVQRPPAALPVPERERPPRYVRRRLYFIHAAGFLRLAGTDAATAVACTSAGVSGARTAPTRCIAMSCSSTAACRRWEGSRDAAAQSGW